MRVLLAGATGLVGQEVLALLLAEGHWVRTLSRDTGRAQSLRGRVADVRVADATLPHALDGSCDGIDVVVSTLGAPVARNGAEKRSFAAVDVVANLALLAEAKRAGVRRFVYLSVFSQPKYEHTAYVQAHLQVESALAASGLAFTVVRPTGIFGAFTEFLTLARRGRVPVIGSGAALTNPVHEREVALAVIRGLQDAAPRAIDLGGPETLSRRAIALLAFAALQRPARLIAMPVLVMGWIAALYGLVNQRMGEFLRFVIAASTSDCVAPSQGTLRLSEYLAERAARER